MSDNVNPEALKCLEYINALPEETKNDFDFQVDLLFNLLKEFGVETYNGEFVILDSSGLTGIALKISLYGLPPAQKVSYILSSLGYDTSANIDGLTTTFAVFKDSEVVATVEVTGLSVSIGGEPDIVAELKEAFSETEPEE